MSPSIFLKNEDGPQSALFPITSATRPGEAHLEGDEAATKQDPSTLMSHSRGTDFITHHPKVNIEIFQSSAEKVNKYSKFR
jgi:hypothetical protein